MCGRFLLNEEAYQEAKSIAHIPDWIQEKLRFGEIYPTNEALVLQKSKQDAGLEGAVLKFGYAYTRPNETRKQLILNARAETVETKWMFRRAFERDRVVVVASAFYEWSKEKQKVAYYEPGQTLYLAAIAKEDGFIILTKGANDSVKDVHHRMPVILDGVQAKAWVENPDLAKALMETVSPQLAHSHLNRQLSLFD